MDPCSRHIEIVETLDEHEDRIKYLEIRDTATSVQLENLIKRVDKLIETFENFMDCTKENDSWRNGNHHSCISGVFRMVYPKIVGIKVWHTLKSLLEVNFGLLFLLKFQRFYKV